MRVVLLGTGGYHPNDLRETACVMLPEAGAIFDAGTSFYRVATQLRTNEVDIFLTHAHLDHVVGLTFFLVPLYTGQVKQARVHANLKTLDAVQNIIFNETVFPVKPPYIYRELQPETRLADGGIVTHVPQTHPGGSVGYRIDWPDRSLAYITDTYCDGSSLEFIRGVDVLLHECNFTDAQDEWAVTTGHSTPTPVAKMAREAGVGRLVLIHMDPSQPVIDPLGVDQIRRIFPRTEIGQDLMEIEF